MSTSAPKVDVNVADLYILQDAIEWARQYHTHKDRMNAATHTSPVRLSEITESLNYAGDLVGDLIRYSKE